MQDLPDIEPEPLFDDVGDYRCLHHVTEVMIDSNIFQTEIIDYQDLLLLQNQNLTPSKVDYSQFQSKLAWLPIDIIEKTFSRTNQFYRMPMGTYLKKWYKPHSQHATFIIKMSPLLQTQCTLTHLQSWHIYHSSILCWY